MRKRGNGGRQHYTCWSDDDVEERMFHTRAHSAREAAVEFAQRHLSHLAQRRVEVRSSTGDISRHDI